ncbi:uncharacterized protein LOC117334613 isoform X2 [Pecten maximus]|uniref:uncharacterized protein LOC117334613 isoform X2 n=1 Tax=Pecten maximus TaxID=6579 RepID=UPI001458CC57|nr:uncharacterized protein LOC117334613 isoform X2 [Pecten maximus]
MDFPEANFPNQSSQTTKRHEVFYEYGSHGNVDVGSHYGQKNDVFFQKVPEGFQRKEDNLCARRPTLPLLSRPESVCTNNTNDLMKEILKNQEEALNFKKLVKLYNFKNHTLSDRVKWQIRSYYSSSTQTRGGEKELRNGLLQKLTEQYQKYRELSDISKTNSEYAGGCVSYLRSSRSSDKKNTDVRLVSAAGNNFSQLRITHIQIDHKELTLSPTHHEILEDSPVREVTSRCVSGVEHIAVRGLNTCRLYSNGHDGGSFTSVEVADFSPQQGYPTSVCLSNYIPGDCLVSMTTGAVYLWSPDNRLTKVIEDKPTRFSCTLPWRRAEFGAHPREVVASDPTVVQLFDVRSSRKPGVDLFALPSPLLMMGERIHISTQSTASEFYHFVACDYSLFLLDQRFPSTPVLSWKHMLANPPQYLEGVNFPTRDHSLLLICSQSPPEVCCYNYKCSSGKAAQALGAPWRVSRIDDVFHHGSVCGGTAEIVLTERFNTSLTGIATVPLDDGFFAVQMDSYGEIFYQGYQFSGEVHDKTCSTEREIQSWDDITIKKGLKWISRYVKKSKEMAKDKNNKQILTPQTNYVRTNLSLAKQPHISCPLCHPEVEKIDADTDHCPACHQSLTTGQQLVQAGKRVVRYQPDGIRHWGDRYKSKEYLWETPHNTQNSGNLKEMPESSTRGTKESFPKTNALSKILVALWEEESPDLTALLLEKDEEVKKKKEENKEKRLNKSNRVENDDQQLIRNLQQAVEGGNLPPARDCGSGNMELINNRESDGEDSDASFHRLFGIETLREDEDLPENVSNSSSVTTGAVLENLENTDFTKVHSRKKRKRRSSSESFFSNNSNQDVIRQSTNDLENFSSDKSYRVTQSTDGYIENIDEGDSQFFSQDIAQSFTMFSGSLPNKTTPIHNNSQLTSFTPRLQQDGAIDSPKTDWKSHKKKRRMNLGF